METLLAHQGGWDEILLVAGPILVIAGLLRLAKKRVQESSRTTSAPSDDSLPTKSS
jgi:hypothetical protein